MECDSDESERWEDFFGSSTDLSPSVIGYYDRLSSSSSSADTTSSSHSSSSHSRSRSNSNCNGNGKSSLENPASKQNSNSHKVNGADSSPSSVLISRVKSPKPPLPSLPPPSVRLQCYTQRRNFRVLSPNVKRIISHSNTALDTVRTDQDDDDDHETMNESKKQTTLVNESFLHDRRTKGGGSGSGRFKHPLSKNTGKLTQWTNELVIDDSDGGYATPSDCSEIIDCVTTNNGHGDGEADDDADEDEEDDDDHDHDHDKTPTNEHSPVIDFAKAAAEALATTTTTTSFERDENSNQVLDEMTKANKLLCAIVIGTNGDEAKQDCLPVEPTTPVANTPSPLLSLPKNSGSFLHSMFAKSDEKLPTGERCTSQFYVDPDEEDVPASVSPNASLPVIAESSKVEEKTPTNVDSKRTKVRPLSAVSITSSSSSSSSGSDELSQNQTAISYLASVESLADHSETESIRTGSSITVLERACMEILDSEQNYVDDLCQVINGYLNDWRERACLDVAELNLLFGNIEQVCDFNMILLDELKSSGMEPSGISNCFIKLQNQFDAYTQYCTSYPDAISLLTVLLQASPTNSLLTSTQKRLNHTLPLGSYLLKPVQRILKYHLLLDNLRKHCDVPEVAEAHEIMKNVARNIDQVKRHLEQQSRVKELSGILDGWLGPELTVLGELKLEGMLMESNKPRIVLLFENMLIITKKKEDNRLQLKTYIQCKDLMLIEHFRGEPASFSVIPYNDAHPTQIKLTARNRELKRQWAQHIKHVMLAHFNIPNRAKELLFKLGEEEDMPAHKNTWKWSHNSSSTTPEYLGRRNQFRRSEMRYRTKKARELFANTLSMVEDIVMPIGSDDMAPPAEVDKTKVVLDSMIKELQQRNSTVKCDDDGDDVAAAKDPDEIATEASEDMYLDGDCGEKPRKNSALDRAKQKLQEVRKYNTKTLPKRIANLKKQRSKTLKETSHFYMDLPPAEKASPNVLKIVEGPEKAHRRRASLDGSDATPKMLSTDDGVRKMSTASLASMPAMSLRIEPSSEHGPTKRDIDIIAELLKHHKDDFDRILKKPPKKAISLNDMDRSSTSNLILKAVEPPPPSSSVDISPQQSLAQRLSNFKRDVELSEPLYESLLRNVHVPYKFPSPILNRSKSQPQCRFTKVRRPTEAPPKRPDSDYVSLMYAESGELAGVDGKLLLWNNKKRSNLRKSDTNINYNGHRSSSNDDNDVECDAISMDNGNESLDTISVDAPSELSLSMVDYHKSVDDLDALKPKLPERRVSDVTGMHHKSIIHKQGGKALGSRIAIADYEDPKILFANHQSRHRRSQTFINRISMQNIQLQRDSVLSSTSSNDSVNTNHVTDSTTTVNRPPSPPFDPSKPLPALPNVDDCYYEKNIDSCLESDEVFRDSAIYSDECNDKRYMRAEHIYSTIDEVKETSIVPAPPTPPTPISCKPIPPPKIASYKIAPIPLRTAPPPPLPAKPTNYPASPRTISSCDSVKSVSSEQISMSTAPPSEPPPPLPPPLVPPRRDRPPSQTSVDVERPLSMAPLGDLPPIPVQESKSVSSWVLKQIKNFDK